MRFVGNIVAAVVAETRAQAVDAVEKSRGFLPPIFVDIRIRRSGRAEAFKGSNFEDMLGPDRHRWMKSLGNEAIIEKTKKRIQIADPLAAHELLYRALDAAEQGRRVIFFCGCRFPKKKGKIDCHREEVASLLVKVAKQRTIPIEIVEWPGGKARHVDLKVEPSMFRALANGRWSIPIGLRPKLSEVAALPWGTTATVHSDGEELHRLIGPATHERGEWSLPVICQLGNADAPLIDYKRQSPKTRRYFGHEPRRSI